jgi:hypothetical protein
MAQRALGDSYGWPASGDLALATWVLGAVEPDREAALGHLADLLGFTLDPGFAYLDHDAISLDVTAIGRLDVTRGPLRHGRLPRLQARAWLDVTRILHQTGRNHRVALDIARQCYECQDIEPRGHLWDPSLYHRFTDAIRVSDEEMAAWSA